MALFHVGVYPSTSGSSTTFSGLVFGLELSAGAPHVGFTCGDVTTNQLDPSHACFCVEILMSSSILISSSILDQLLQHSESHPETESCGLLSGSNSTITDIHPTKNSSPSPRASYEIDPAEIFPILRQLRAAGQELLGIYHSHPHSDNYPSPRDIELAFHPSVAYFIVTLLPHAPQKIRAFRLAPHQPVLELSIIEVPA